MDESLTTLAMTGATTIMSAMATSAWAAARAGTIRLFRRSEPEDQRALEARLDREAVLVRQEPDPDSARRDLVGGWRLQLVALLREHPEAEAEIEALVASVNAQLPSEGKTSWIQNVSAKDHGMAFGAQGGGITVHHTPAVPQPMPARDGNSD
ncbi:hypothetical protein [Streptomyces viridosporus]|uniref:hypothetical protein n=1 Tax=Streptomyces viridosporus TaxID=67581 RepID=UPI0009C1150F|nr:hypothetical protein [Streptomyces viridosporus]